MINAAQDGEILPVAVPGEGSPLEFDELLANPPKRTRRGRISINSYGMLFSSFIVILAVGVFAISMLNYLTALSRGDLEERGRLVVDSVESSISQDLALDDQYAVVERCAALVKDSENIEYIVVTARDGASLVHTKEGWTMEEGDVRWADYEGEGSSSKILNSPFDEGAELLQFSHQISYLTSMPLGWVHIGVSMDAYRENLERFHKRTLSMALLALAIGIPASLLFSRQITRPITRLQNFAERIASGDLTEEVHTGGSKEIVRLSDTMNWMNERLAESRDRLRESLKEKASLREKDVLLREIHHRVKNNMQILGGLIRIQCRGIESEEVRSVLRESETRIRSMALLHQKLYQSESISEIVFAGYVRTLTDELRRLYVTSARAVRVEVDIDPGFRLGLDTALPCGLIINELVSNCFKYGFPDGREGTIRIRVTPGASPEAFILEVSDDGVGLPQDFTMDGVKTLGIRLVNMLVEQLDGTVRTEEGQGARFVLTLEKSNYAERLENDE